MELRGGWNNYFNEGGQRKPCVRNHGKKNTQRKRDMAGEEMRNERREEQEEGNGTQGD